VTVLNSALPFGQISTHVLLAGLGGDAHQMVEDVVVVDRGLGDIEIGVERG